MLLLLLLLFKKVLCHGPSTMGKKNPSGKILVVGHSREDAKFWGGSGSKE